MTTRNAGEQKVKHMIQVSNVSSRIMSLCHLMCYHYIALHFLKVYLLAHVVPYPCCSLLQGARENWRRFIPLKYKVMSDTERNNDFCPIRHMHTSYWIVSVATTFVGITIKIVGIHHDWVIITDLFFYMSHFVFGCLAILMTLRIIKFPRKIVK